MTELYTNIKPEIKSAVEAAWQIAMTKKEPASAANFLNLVTQYYGNIYTEEERDFFIFYFNTKMLEEQKQ